MSEETKTGGEVPAVQKIEEATGKAVAPTDEIPPHKRKYDYAYHLAHYVKYFGFENDPNFCDETFIVKID